MKLNLLEERILKYLIQNGNSLYGINIPFQDVELGFLIQAIENMENLNLVKNCSTNSCAAALLTERGLSYYEDLQHEKYGDLFDNIKTIDNYIIKAEALKQSKTEKEIKYFIRHIFLAYKDKFASDALYMFNTSFGDDASSEMEDYYIDLDGLIILLNKLKNDLIYEAKNMQMEKIKIENKIINSISISIDQTIEQINNCKELTDSEKIELQNLIMQAMQEKDKSTKWQKCKNILGKFLNKGLETALAILPIIIECLKK